ncbi:TIM barrel protein [Christensenella timonensis]|uniref:TIM barrel protein n=1 Tax=Christensenella timonensis TaxID=1816678 RepID=UPI0008319725|nr:TIM barrel protein [Christensenella timonensis]
MIRFGPAGNSDAFYEEGYKHTVDAPKWIHDMGLNAFEYSFGRGVKLKEETGAAIREKAGEFGVAMSVHAPYYINLANDTEEKFEKNLTYFRESTVAAGYLGAQRIVFHPGSCAKCDRSVAFENVKKNLKRIIGALKDEGFQNYIYCAETMGKLNQIADLDEVGELSQVDDCIYPAIDFGHLNARTLGGIRTGNDYRAIIEKLKNSAGEEKTNHMHVHFSHIQYTDKGEKMHLTFEDKQWGPFFEPLAEILAERNMEPVIICESKGTQARDALAMKEMYEAAKK